MINVTKTFLPSFDEYVKTLRRAWDKAWITNNGVLTQELEEGLRNYLNIPNLLFAGNGTIVLQIAIKALGLSKEIITTPFSYVATTNAILWENCSPVFVDICPDTLCIDADKIEQAITSETQAILATHVYGLPCNVKKIEDIAKKHDLKVIYDGAHAFGCELDNRALLAYGDISTCSFHATKIFHTVEGGCIVANDPEVFDKVFLMRSFGHRDNDYLDVGINGKNSEFHAAMGIVNLPLIGDLIERRRVLALVYNDTLSREIERLDFNIAGFKPNYSYFPVFFKTETELLHVMSGLAAIGINTRRYFYPSLNQLPFLSHEQSCPISEHYSRVALALPMYHDLTEADAKRIADAINSLLRL